MRGHPGSNQGPLDLQSNALPLSYIPCAKTCTRAFILRRGKQQHKNINKCCKQSVCTFLFTYLNLTRDLITEVAL